MYIETSSNNNGDNVFCNFERTDTIQSSNKTFYYNRFSAGGTKSMGRFRIQLLLDDNTWSTQHTICEMIVTMIHRLIGLYYILDFTIENYVIKLLYDEMDCPHADMCFSKKNNNTFYILNE